jgi:amino acid transporter
MLPYVALVLALVAVEARIVGAVSARLVPIPPAAGALAFLGFTWAVARSGVRPGLRAQAAATGVLVIGFSLLAVAGVVAAARRPDFFAHLVPAAPAPLALLGGIGQALFLFMGFELVTNQVELVRAPGAIASALVRSVRLLTVFYVLVALGFSTLAAPQAGAAPGSEGDWLTPQLGLGRGGRQPAGAAAIGILCLLASFTSFNGALLTLSRLSTALASQGMSCPRRLARMDARRMVPPDALGGPALGGRRVDVPAVDARAHQCRARRLGRRRRAGLGGGGRRAGALALRRAGPPRGRQIAALALASLFLVFGVSALAEGFAAPSPRARGGRRCPLT